MPTNRINNLIYRLLLQFAAPSSGSEPVSEMSGHKIFNESDFAHLIKKHHILGSVTVLESGDHSSFICTSSVNPVHNANPETYFRVASITKMATSVLVLRLRDQNYLSIDEPVSLYLPDLSGLNRITLRHLLSHTSGIVDPPGLETALNHKIPFMEFVTECCKLPAGIVFRYSNLGFGLIGSILESIFGENISSVFHKYLFSPLGLNATLEGCSLPRDKIMPVTRVLPYKKGKDLVITPLGAEPLNSPDPSIHYGYTAGSMYIDAFSLKKLLYVIMRLNTGFLSEKSCEEMKSLYASYGRSSPTLSYGLGLLRINDSHISPYTIYGHQGFAYGCADGAFWEDQTGRILIHLNGGCSESRIGRLGQANRDIMIWAFRKELALW